MLNTDKTEYSQNIIEEQMSYVKAAYPYIRQVIKIDPSENLLADYIYGVDAIGIDTRGNAHKIQFKHREAGKNDLVLPAIKLTGKNVEANNLGFDYKGNTYTFRPYADITPTAGPTTSCSRPPKRWTPSCWTGPKRPTNLPSTISLGCSKNTLNFLPVNTQRKLRPARTTDRLTISP